MKAAFDKIFVLYVGRQFFIRFAGLLAFFVIVLQMLDLLNRSENILAPEGAGIASVIEYVRLRAPAIASQFAPFAALLAVIFTLSVLSHTNEVTVMRAAGMSIHRVLFPIGVVCALIAFGHFAFHEAVVVGSAEKLAYWEANDYAVDLDPDDGGRADLRLAHDNQFIHAASARRGEDGVYMRDVTINTMSPEGLVLDNVTALRAQFQGGQWRLFDVRSFNVGDLTVRRLPSATWTTTLNPEILFALTLNPDRTSIPELVRKIAQLEADSANTRAATTSLLSRFSRPCATLVMPLIGAFAGFGVRRQRNQLERAVGAATLGFSYFVIENMMLALGKLGVAPAMLGAFFPFAIFLVIGFTILLAMEN